MRLKLYKGNVIVIGRESAEVALFDQDLVTFEDDAGAYDQHDAAGFIKLNALRLRTLGAAAAEAGGLTQSCLRIKRKKLRRRRRPRRAGLPPRPGDRNFAVETADTAQEPLRENLCTRPLTSAETSGCLSPAALRPWPGSDDAA